MKVQGAKGFLTRFEAWRAKLLIRSSLRQAEAIVCNLLPSGGDHGLLERGQQGLGLGPWWAVQWAAAGVAGPLVLLGPLGSRPQKRAGQWCPNEARRLTQPPTNLTGPT
jgi:hypothetical protein